MEQHYGELYKTTKVCIDGYSNRVLKGRIYQYNPEFEEGICFHSSIEFLKCMESVMETTNFPGYQECRRFQPIQEETAEKPSSACSKRGKAATFVVRVLFRQHASWQGTVLWCEKGQEESFRSVLELLLLMDSTMQETVA